MSWEPSAEEVNAAFNRAAEGALKDILDYSEALLVSSDIVGNPASWIFDSQLTMSVARTVKVLGWYDNEWGFSNRTAALVQYIGERLWCSLLALPEQTGANDRESSKEGEKRRWRLRFTRMLLLRSMKRRNYWPGT